MRFSLVHTHASEPHLSAVCTATRYCRVCVISTYSFCVAHMLSRVCAACHKTDSPTRPFLVTYSHWPRACTRAAVGESCNLKFQTIFEDSVVTQPSAYYVRMWPYWAAHELDGDRQFRPGHFRAQPSMVHIRVRSGGEQAHTAVTSSGSGRAGLQTPRRGRAVREGARSAEGRAGHGSRSAVMCGQCAGRAG